MYWKKMVCIRTSEEVVEVVVVEEENARWLGSGIWNGNQAKIFNAQHHYQLISSPPGGALL